MAQWSLISVWRLASRWRNCQADVPQLVSCFAIAFASIIIEQLCHMCIIISSHTAASRRSQIPDILEWLNNELTDGLVGCTQNTFEREMTLNLFDMSQGRHAQDSPFWCSIFSILYQAHGYHCYKPQLYACQRGRASSSSINPKNGGPSPTYNIPRTFC
jgi:hypothetical protein